MLPELICCRYARLCRALARIDEAGEAGHAGHRDVGGTRHDRASPITRKKKR